MRGLVVSCACVLALLPRAASAESWPQVHILDTFTAQSVRSALDGAARRLRTPRCAEVFSSPQLLREDGQPLRSRLAELQTEGHEYLGRLSFFDASATGPCRRENVLAFTTVGGNQVFVCSRLFLQTWRRGPYYVELTVIHEMLHSLGLGENPPTSRAITNAVREHCDGAE